MRWEDRMRLSFFLRNLLFLLVVGLLFVACAGSSEEGGLSPQPATQAVTRYLTPSYVPLPTRTPAPTARPLHDETSEGGAYQNLLTGVSFEYPTEWELEVKEDSGFEFVIVQNSDPPIIVYLEMLAIAQDEDFQILAEENFNSLPDILDMRLLIRTESDQFYELSDGTDAWWGMGEGILAGMRDPINFEILATQRGNLLFQMTIIGTSEGYVAFDSELDQVRQSFQVFSPRPYGVVRENALFLASNEPTTFDPAKWHFGPDSVIGDLYSGLVKLNTELQVIPDLAESWTVSSDGRIYTFKLRQGVTFHNGRPFTAHDVKYSWERACDPDTESDTAETYLGDIQGAASVVSGEDDDISGVTVLDDYTLEVTLDKPKAYFPYKLAYVTSWIVDRETIDEIETAPNGTGPYKLIKHNDEELIILARNENYYRTFVNLEYVVYLINQGPQIRLYESGDIDMVYVNEDLIERAKDPLDPLFGNVQTVSELCTYYVVYDVTRPPFDELKVREAFTKAIDKDRFNDVVEEGKGVIAKGLYPPGLPGYNVNVQPVLFNPEQARTALESSSFRGPDGLPEIVLTSSGEGGDLYPDDAILLQMWEKVLGVNIKVEQIDSDNFFDEIYAGHHGQLMTLGWCADYPDPQNFADILLHSGSKMNHSGYSNPALDALLESARSPTDVDTRLQLYQEIEQLIIDDMPLAFLRHSRPYYMITKPYVHGFETSPIGVAQLMDISIFRDDE